MCVIFMYRYQLNAHHTTHQIQTDKQPTKLEEQHSSQKKAQSATEGRIKDRLRQCNKNSEMLYECD